MRILIGEISSYKAIVIARYIHQKYPNVELSAYDNKPLVKVIHTRYITHIVHIPFSSQETYVEELSKYVQTNNIDVLLPVHSDSIGVILRHKKWFGHALDWIGEYDDYMRLHEKDKLMNIASMLDIRVPQSYKSIGDARVPFVVKPINLSSAKGVRYYTCESDKLSIGAIPRNTICQEYISGQGCGYEVYCQDGKILTEYGHIRLAEWPISGGSSVLRERYIHPQMRAIAEKILSVVPWSGFAMFEFKLTSSNELILIEVNPRIWGSINQALQDGCPMFEHVIKNCDGFTISGDRAEYRTELWPQVWLAMIGYAFRGEGKKVLDWIKHLRSTRRDVSFWTDPLGLISIIIRKLQ